MALQESCLQVHALPIDGLTADVTLRTRICQGELNETLRPDAEAGFYSTLSPICRQIYDGTCLLPYVLNFFGFKSIDTMKIWISSRLPIQLHQIKAIKAPHLFEICYWKKSNCRFTDRCPHLEVLYLDLWNARQIREMDGWSADQIEQDLRDRTKVLLGKEKGCLKVVVTDYTNLRVGGKNILQAV